MIIFDYISNFIYYAVIAIILYVITVVIARVIANYMDLNPFSRISRTIRRLSDPILGPVRSYLIRRGFKPNLAPLLTILLAVFGGLFVIQIVRDIIFVLSGSIASINGKQIGPLIGFLLYGLLALYSLMLILRIVFDWLMLYRNSLSKFLFIMTEPVLSQFRRLIPTIGMFDISPLVVFILITLFQRVILSTLIAPAFMPV